MDSSEFELQAFRLFTISYAEAIPVVSISMSNFVEICRNYG